MAVFSTNLIVYTHTDFEQTFLLEDNQANTAKDLTGFTAQSQIRKTAAHYQFADFTVGITSAAQGLVNVSVASTINEKWRPGRYKWDLILTRPSGFKFVAVEGQVLVRTGITTHTFLYGYGNP